MIERLPLTDGALNGRGRCIRQHAAQVRRCPVFRLRAEQEAREDTRWARSWISLHKRHGGAR
jgi:hypothetical protein